MDNKVRDKKNKIARSKASNRKGKQMRPVPTIRVFGYGSLLNKENVQARLPGKEINASVFGQARLGGYQRSFTKRGRDHLYLTLRRVKEIIVGGVLIDVDPIEFAILTRHEPGYDLVDVTHDVLNYHHDYPDSPRVYCYIAEPLKVIAPEIAKIRRSYLDKCLGGVPPEKHDQWLKETHIPAGVVIAEED